MADVRMKIDFTLLSLLTILKVFLDFSEVVISIEEFHWWFKGTVKWWTKWRWPNFLDFSYLNSLIIIKLAFSQQEHVQIFPLPSSSKTCALPFDFALERDPKNIFYYQHDIENYTDQVLNFLLFDRHEYVHTESSSL